MKLVLVSRGESDERCKVEERAWRAILRESEWKSERTSDWTEAVFGNVPGGARRENVLIPLCRVLQSLHSSSTTFMSQPRM